jgi:hypothetical protein
MSWSRDNETRMQRAREMQARLEDDGDQAPVTRVEVAEWLASYERAWRTAGTEGLRELFADDATYRLDPYDEPLEGLQAIAAMWEAERDGPDEAFTMTSEIVAVEADTAVARVEVTYDDPPREYRDLWVMRFGPGTRAVAFEEWPFHPDRPRAADDAAAR